MRLSQVIELLGNSVLQVVNPGNTDPEFDHIESDSRVLRERNLFVCIKGSSFDSHLVVRELQRKGAVALIAELPIEDEEVVVPIVYVKSSRLVEALLTMEEHSHPYRKLTTIGVTGTNGKTTITTLIYHVLSSFERKASLIGTVRNVVGESIYSNPKNTTPGPIELAKLLQLSAEKKSEYFIMEVSSHSLSMNRVEGMRFDVGIISNVTRDHLDFHPTFDDYYRSKMRLFSLLKTNGIAIVNGDKINIADIHIARNRITTYGFGDESDYRIENLDISRTGMDFTIQTPYGSSHRIYSRLIGEHNAYNIAAAVATLNSLNYDLDHIAKAISSFGGVPGRFEFVEEATKYGFDVVIDFAHTPDALEKLLKTARRLTPGRLILVFGAGGSADKGKRPLMAEVSSKFSDVVILTSDDPKLDDPTEILSDLESGVDKFKPYLVIPDRREAISVALTLANRQDMVLIAGRGHEDFQLLRDRKIPFNDKQVVKDILESKFRRHIKK
ncbi:UDP-N-acetylmuramyl peptide synthase [Mesotoga sp. SC_4PWA21]|nr:UDP-N-acetylmuramyl peptide synthase [Mesotoga sp. SC_4PWA21]